MNHLNITRFPALDYTCNEAINTLCTNLFYCGDNIRSVMVTSRYQHEGKSSITMNMMRTLASCGKRVALLDADLRCSDLARRYGFVFPEQGANGLAQYLAGMCSLDDAFYETNLPNAYIIPVGHEVINSLQLLSSPRFGAMMEALQESFDVILVDTPPAGIIVDAVEIAKYCDGALIVVSYNTGRKQEIGEVASNIAKTGCKVLGAVMNGVDFGNLTNRKYYYRYGKYSNYNHYGKPQNTENKANK